MINVIKKGRRIIIKRSSWWNIILEEKKLILIFSISSIRITIRIINYEKSDLVLNISRYYEFAVKNQEVIQK